MLKKIAPSMMCADIFNMRQTINIFEEARIEYLHIDIMDGIFVPNYTLGPDYCKALRKHTAIPLDIHLMVERPEEKIGYFDICEGDYVSVHVESTHHLQRTLSMIRSLGAKTMAAINPATPMCVLENVLDDIDGVLVMTVNPGFAGQKLVPKTLDKILSLRKFLDDNGYSHIEIEADGNVSFENARLMNEAGANIFVAGTSSIFSPAFPLKDGIIKLREVIKG